MTTTATDRAVLVTDVAIKAPCRVATTANITLSGLQTIDDVAVVADDRVLVKNQTTQSDNGIYKVSSSAWSRTIDFDGNNDVATGTVVFITNGTTNGSSMYQLTTANPITIGSSNLTFTSIAIVIGGSLTGFVLKSGDTMTGALVVPAGASGSQVPRASEAVLKTGGTMTGELVTVASATGTAGFNLPHGVAPTSPADGDVWTTSAGGLFARINGVTQNLTYTEGTYNPTVTCGTSGTITLNSANDTLSYERIGNMVCVHGYLQVASVSSPVGLIKITVPFTGATIAEGGDYFVGTCIISGTVSAGAGLVPGYMDNPNTIALYLNGTTTLNGASAQQIQANSDIYINMVYRAA